MTDSNPTPITPPMIPDPAPAAASAGQPAWAPLGASPDEQTPIPNTITAVESILRQPRRVLCQLRQPRSGRLIATMVFVALVCSLIYGVGVGAISRRTPPLAAPVQIAVRTPLSALIRLPGA